MTSWELLLTLADGAPELAVCSTLANLDEAEALKRPNHFPK